MFDREGEGRQIEARMVDSVKKHKRTKRKGRGEACRLRI